MTLLNDADAIYLGSNKVDAVYAGGNKVWPSTPVIPDTLVVSYAPGAVRNDFTGMAGMTFTPAKDMAVNKIGGMCGSGTLGPQTIVFRTDPAPGTELARVTIDMTDGTPGEWYWVDIPEITLTMGATYVLWAVVTQGDGYMWADGNPRNVALRNCDSWYGAYNFAGPDDPLVQYYVFAQMWGVDLAWVTPAQNLVISLEPASTYRNDWTGAVGIIFSLTQPMTFNKIGARWGGGATGPQTVALRNNDTATELARVTVDMIAGVVGQFFWADIPEITLDAGVNYVLWVQTTSGDGFTWVDLSQCIVSNGATWGAVYGYSITDNGVGAGGNNEWYGVDLDFT